MANRWLYAGSDLGTVRTVGSPTYSTTAGRYNGTYTDGGIAVTGSNYFFVDFLTSAGASDSVTTGETLWYHATLVIAASTANNRLELVDGSDQPWLAIRVVSAGNLGLYYNSGTGGTPAWTQIGSSWAQTFGTPDFFDIDIKLTLGSPHSAEVFTGGVSRASGTFTQASLTAIDAVRHLDSGSSTGYVSGMMAAVGINTVGGHLYTGKPTGAGATSGWTGLYSTIDDAGIDDTDLISSGTAGQKSTFAYADLPTLGSGYVLGDLFMYTRAKNDGASPTNVKPVKRTAAGVDGVGSSFSGIGAGFAEFLTRYTGITETEYNGSQFGVESAA